MALKIQKEREMKVHEEFYNNVHLLTLSYPPVESFIAVFKKDMFLKTNKVGFQQVMYYLLEILDKEMLKQKVPTWPLYDVRSENEFRNEVMKYINELNTLYEDANIPNIATSHLITPGGFKFIKFMFKLSQFVLYQYLQHNNGCANIMLPLRPSKKESVTKENIDRMEIAAQNINMSTNNITINFEGNFQAAKLDSQDIMRKLCAVTDLNEEYKLKLSSLKDKLDDETNLEVSLNIHTAIKNNFEKLKLLKEKAEYVNLLNSYLEKSLRLTYHGEFSNVSDPTKQIQIENGNLDLANLMESCILFTDRKRFEVKPMSRQHLEKEVERFNALNKKLISILEGINSVHSKSITLSEKLKNEHLVKLSLQGKCKSILNSNLNSDIDLALPLTITP